MKLAWVLSIVMGAALVTPLLAGVGSTGGPLHVFTGTPDGGDPIAPVIADSKGNLFGTTHFGGTANEGSVFELMSDGHGGYTYAVIYSFAFGVGDAEQPDSGPLLLDSEGNLYGTTMYGGLGGVGTVYELSPVAGGTWTEKVIYSFQFNNGDGFYPQGGVIMDASGNLYGATENGGTNNVGTVFRLAPDGSGGWNESILYSFTGNRNSGPDGAAPVAGVALDSVGNLYGTTFLGGRYLNGIVFELSPGQGSTWTEKIIHAFTGTDGCNPSSKLVVDSANNVYGTTFSLGGVNSTCGVAGTVFRLSATSSGNWTETVLHKFQDTTHDGNYPNGIMFDSAGNLYGTTYLGGTFGFGELFRLSPTASGPWTESQVHIFAGGRGAGWPLAGPTLGPDGNLYGTASSYGGTTGKNSGAVYRFVP